MNMKQPRRITAARMARRVSAAKHYNPDPTYLKSLIADSHLTRAEVARRIGVSERTLRYYLSSPDDSGKHRAPYAVQFTLEALARKI